VTAAVTARRLLGPALVLALALAGCGPKLLWSGRTPDRRHAIEVVEDAGLSYVVVDGKRRAAYRGIAGWSIAFSPRGSMAYAARVGRRWVVVHDGAPGEPWDSVGELVLSATGRLAYAAERAKGWHAVVDHRAGPRFDAILAGTLRFSADGRRVAYAGRAAGRVRVVADGVPGPTFDGVGRLELSADGARIAYAARRGLDAHVVVDGATGPRLRAVGKLALSPRGGRVAYAGLDRDGWRVITDGEPGPAVGAVRHLLFRDDGRHLAWIARVGERDVLALDGAPVAAWPTLRAAAVSFRPADAPGDGPGLAHVAPADGGERVVVDGAPGATYAEVGTPVFSRDGRLAYAARRGAAWLVVAGGRELPGGTTVGDPVFSPDGRRLAYLARRGPAVVAVVDGRDHRFDLALEGSLAFSADSRRWAVIAGDLAREQLFFAIDGARRVPLPAIEVYAAAAQRTASLDDIRATDNGRLQAWSRAEADRAAAP
jgi:hypothetical protein